MLAARSKCDDGHSYSTKCFPARTLLHRRKDGAGHWLVAYREAEKQKHTNVHRRIKESVKKQESSLVSVSNTLDGPFLLKLHCVDKPSELCSVDVSEQTLNLVKPEDLKVFYNVAYVDASVNSLSLGSFSSFVSLKRLNLSLNSICNMKFDPSDFPHLEVLDLSYNSLSADDVASIGRLPHLKALHLTGNKLHHLPPNMGSSSKSAEEDDTQFRALEVLMLDDNRLTCGVFNSLTNLNRLKHLNLQKNRIREVPYLERGGRSKPVPRSEEEIPAHTAPDAENDEAFKRISELEEHEQGSSSPLPELQFLDLSDNKIAEEEALMAVALFPMLREIDIHSNPLTTQRSGDPPLLTHYLHERLGITIKRKKTPPLKMSISSEWQEERIPKVSKKQTLMDLPGPSQSQESQNSMDDTFPENTDHFFVTQSEDVSEYGSDLRADEKKSVGNDDNLEDDRIPEQFNCYKMLMDVKPNPEAVEPIGIQTAVRMLEHTLKNLNVYRDSKPKLDSIQMPYREREKRIKDLPPLKPIKQPNERVDEMIKEIKGSTTRREVALSTALDNIGVNRQEYKEALSLLRDMKTKYKMVHERTMEQAASQMFQPETDRNTNLDGAQPPSAQML